MILLLFWVVILVVALWLYCRNVYSYFQKHGIKYMKPFPLIGNLGGVLLRKEHFVTDVINLYKAFPEERFVGRYDFTNRVVYIRDLDLAKKITVKDFEHFLDHSAIFTDKDSFFSRVLTALKGQEWKDMRSTLSPAFTSSKIRHMVPFMEEVGDQMMAAIEEKIRSSDRCVHSIGYVDIDCRDLTTRYANDVIATCAFGLKVDSQKDQNNDFYEMGKKTTTAGLCQVIVFLLVMNLPMVAKILKLEFLPESSKQFFRDLVLGTMKNREQKNIIRPDMIHLLMEAKKGTLMHENNKPHEEKAGFATVEESSTGVKQVNTVWSDDDLVAQAVLFFLAGFDTVATAMSFLLYELAINPEVQEELAQEIKDHDMKNGGKLDLKSLQEMTYLDMVLSELLRMWPPGLILDRLCTKDYNLGKPNDRASKDYILRKGCGIAIPTIAIHRDPQYFPDPDKFDPERFSEENKHKIHAMAYMPFGSGPRNCIASRFALCEVKIMVYQVLRNLVISPCEKTCIPAKLCKTTQTVKLEGGHWLRFKTRT